MMSTVLIITSSVLLALEKKSKNQGRHEVTPW